jgi:hypothetical protein
MSQDYVQDSPICFQQVTTGALSGTMVGYPFLAYSVGGNVGQFRQTTYGVYAATPTIQFVNPGVTAPLHVQNQGGNVTVFLAYAAGAITSKLSDVAAALAAYVDDQGQYSPILLGVTTDGTITAALAATPMVGGLMPTSKQGMLRFDLGSTAGGLVYLDTRYPAIVEQMEVYAAAGTAKIQIVTVDNGLVVSATEKVDITGKFTLTVKSSRYTGVPILLGPKQALSVTGITAGSGNLIRVWVRLAGASL